MELPRSMRSVSSYHVESLKCTIHESVCYFFHLHLRCYASLTLRLQLQCKETQWGMRLSLRQNCGSQYHICYNIIWIDGLAVLSLENVWHIWLYDYVYISGHFECSLLSVQNGVAHILQVIGAVRNPRTMSLYPSLEDMKVDKFMQVCVLTVISIMNKSGFPLRQLSRVPRKAMLFTVLTVLQDIAQAQSTLSASPSRALPEPGSAQEDKAIGFGDTTPGGVQ